MNVKRLVALLMCMIFVAFGLFACSRARSDADLTADVQARIHANAALAAAPINVQSNSGVVVLSGSVETDAARSSAENAAKQVEEAGCSGGRRGHYVMKAEGAVDAEEVPSVPIIDTSIPDPPQIPALRGQKPKEISTGTGREDQAREVRDAAIEEIKGQIGVWMVVGRKGWGMVGSVRQG